MKITHALFLFLATKGSSIHIDFNPTEVGITLADGSTLLPFEYTSDAVKKSFFPIPYRQILARINPEDIQVTIRNSLIQDSQNAQRSEVIRDLSLHSTSEALSPTPETVSIKDISYSAHSFHPLKSTKNIFCTDVNCIEADPSLQRFIVLPAGSSCDYHQPLLLYSSPAFTALPELQSLCLISENTAILYSLSHRNQSSQSFSLSDSHSQTRRIVFISTSDFLKEIHTRHAVHEVSNTIHVFTKSHIASKYPTFIKDSPIGPLFFTDLPLFSFALRHKELKVGTAFMYPESRRVNRTFASYRVGGNVFDIDRVMETDDLYEIVNRRRNIMRGEHLILDIGRYNNQGELLDGEGKVEKKEEKEQGTPSFRSAKRWRENWYFEEELQDVFGEKNVLAARLIADSDLEGTRRHAKTFFEMNVKSGQTSWKDMKREMHRETLQRIREENNEEQKMRFNQTREERRKEEERKKAEKKAAEERMIAEKKAAEEKKKQEEERKASEKLEARRQFEREVEEAKKRLEAAKREYELEAQKQREYETFMEVKEAFEKTGMHLFGKAGVERAEESNLSEQNASETEVIGNKESESIDSEVNSDGFEVVG